jgi:hypothetical protein
MADVTNQQPAEWPFDPETIWHGSATEELFAHAQPWSDDESFEIADLSDEESGLFWAAVNE